MMNAYCLALLITLSLVINNVFVEGQLKLQNHECTSVTIPMCMEMPYNATRMPNLLQHRSQEEAAIMAHEFLPLVDINCSPYSRFFICSVFAPMCTEKVPYGVTSCRTVCTAVKDSCLPLLRNLNLTWPQFLHCDSFPESGLCMKPPKLKNKNHFGPVSHTSAPNAFLSKWGISKGIGFNPPLLGGKMLSGSSSMEALCTWPRLWVQTTDDAGVCVPVCGEDFLFTAKDKKIAVAWSSSWAVVSLLSTSFTLLTFCLNRRRFAYPERPVICLALSYFFYSLPFILRLFLPQSSLSCETDPATDITHLATSGISSPGCVVTFLLQYYFGMASDIWWVILTFCWFMTSTRFWGSEGLNSCASYFHGVAWGVPAIASVVAIALKQVGGDELLGICFVGTWTASSQLYLVALPQGILLLMGTCFLVLGFISLFRIRNAFRKQCLCPQNSASPSTSLTTLPPPSTTTPTTQDQAHGSPTVRLAAHVGKLERLMVRLGVFSVLATVPAVFVFACRIHSHVRARAWEREAAHAHASCETGWNKQSCGPRRSYPDVEIDLLRIFMSLIIGVTSGVWVWSQKTLLLWKETFRKLFGLNPTNPFLKPVTPNRITISGPQATQPNPAPDRNITQGYINLQDSWNSSLVDFPRGGPSGGLIGGPSGGSGHRELIPHHPRCQSRMQARILSDRRRSRQYRNNQSRKLETSSELTSFV